MENFATKLSTTLHKAFGCQILIPQMHIYRSDTTCLTASSVKISITTLTAL